MKNKHDLATVKAQLQRMGVKFGTEKSANTIHNTATYTAGSLGIRSLGRLDYLMNYCGYIIYVR